MVMLQHELGNRLTFIHQEIYVNNEPTRGLRSQLHAFHLETEPWLFTVNREGKIVQSCTPALSQASMMRSQRSVVISSGFSTTTCLPAIADATAGSM